MAMNIDFTGKTVLITGAGRGLGKEMAIQFAGCGANVYLGNRKVDQGEETVAELEAMGVRVNSILPGIIRTAMWEEILDGMANEWNPDVKNTTTPEQREELWNASVKSMIPMGHAQQAEDIAWATVFMASDFAREITGERLSIDGGTTSGR